MEYANSLIKTKTLTISKLMDIMPAGTMDPSPFIYDTTMYAMAGLMGAVDIIIIYFYLIWYILKGNYSS